MNKQILYSAQILHFFNTNQIEKMKINKGELVIREMCSLKPEEFIEQVLQPFEYQIAKKKMVVSVAQRDQDRPSMKADWRLYQLIIFNIIQNAVKYNKTEGAITITTELKDPNQNLPNHMIFETVITDDGKGIEESRVPKLFKVFGELKNNLDMTASKESEDNGIGVGLSCSKIIANAINGDVIIVPNKLNKTRVSVTIMVKIYDRNRRNSNVSQL